MKLGAWSRLAVALLLLGWSACSDDDAGDDFAGDASTLDASTRDGGLDATVPDATADAARADAGAKVLLTIPFPDGDPASLSWNAASETLFIADNTNNQVWRWKESAGLERLATTADPGGAALAGGGTNVGQIVQLADGRLLVNRFGKPGGGFGAVAYLDPTSKEGGLVPNLEPNRKRLGLDVAPDGRIFGSYFQGAMGGGQTGAVTRLDLATGETDYAPGFRKIIGVLVRDGKLYVSDQQADKIYRLPLEGALPAQYTVFASLPRPDQICAGPDGSLFTGQFQAAPGSSDPIAVRQIAADGTVTRFASDPDVSRPSGVAYDAAKRRLFVANGGSPAQQYVRVFSVP